MVVFGVGAVSANMSAKGISCVEIMSWRVSLSVKPTAALTMFSSAAISCGVRGMDLAPVAAPAPGLRSLSMSATVSRLIAPEPTTLLSTVLLTS